MPPDLPAPAPAYDARSIRSASHALISAWYGMSRLFAAILIRSSSATGSRSEIAVVLGFSAGRRARGLRPIEIHRRIVGFPEAAFLGLGGEGRDGFKALAHGGLFLSAPVMADDPAVRAVTLPFFRNCSPPPGVARTAAAKMVLDTVTGGSIHGIHDSRNPPRPLQG